MHTIPDGLLSRAASDPDRLALLNVEGDSLSHFALCSRVAGIALHLRSLEIRPADAVAVVMPPGPAMAIAFLAVSSVAACAPLNPAYRRSDFEFYLSDLRPAAILVPEGFASPCIEVATELEIPVVQVQVSREGWIEGRSAQTSEDHAAVLREVINPHDTALLLHTSGTTSRPKIVPLSHENVCTSALQIARTLRLTPDDRCLDVMPLFHIHGIMAGLLAPLTTGGSTVCVPGFQAGSFLDWVDRTSPTWYTAVPTIHQSILEEGKASPERASSVQLRLIRSSSAALAPSLLQAMENLWNAPVIEAYGMTEASHQMTSNPLPPEQRKPGSVGRAAGPDVAVLDEDWKPLPAGERGEVAIQGRSVTAGYRANPEANEKSFREGWFRTGDEGYFDEDGYLFLTGRLKEMINRGGESIAPREIDEALLRHPSVSQAVAFAVPHETLGEDIAAAIVLKPGYSATEHELRHFAASSITDFKVPSRIVFVDSIPKGPTGKLQRIGLHERLGSLLEVRYAAPRTEEESWVVAAFEKVLGHDRVGRDDNFFSLGGDSLRGVRVMIEIAEVFGEDVPVATLFDFPTPALLGGELASRREEDGELVELAQALRGISEEDLNRLLSGDDRTDSNV